MQFDSRRRVYVNPDGSLVTPRELRERIDQYIDTQQGEVGREAQRMRAGAITVPAFFAWLSKKIEEIHGSVAIVAHGGPENMSNEDWARIGQRVQSELTYLAKFQKEVEAAERAAESLARRAAVAAEVPAGLETVVEERVKAALMANSVTEAETAIREAVHSAIADSVGTEEAASVARGVVETITDSQRMEALIWGEVNSRGRLYMDAAYGTYENSVKAREGEAGAVGVRRVCEDDSESCEECPALAADEYVAMDEITDIGDTPCMSNCRCFFEFDYHGIGPLEIDRSIYE
jgi:hypothetical protein